MDNLTIELTQAPVIEYNAIESIANQVATKMQELDLDNLEVTEDNFKEIKAVRSSLNNEFKEYENKRKLIKDMVMKPYNDFETKYKQISTYYKGADEKLKAKINEVEENLLNEKINRLKEYFKEINKFDFIKFEDLEIKITRSASDKSIKEEINSIIEKIKVELATIDTLDNKDRVMAKYQITKNLSKSIADVNMEIAQEKRIADAQSIKEQAPIKDKQPVINEPKAELQTPAVETSQDDIKTVSFKASGTIEQLKEFKAKIIEIAKGVGVEIE